MEKQNKTTKKLKSFMWFLIGSLPLILFIGYFILNFASKNETSLDGLTYMTNINSMVNSFNTYVMDVLTNSTISQTFNKLINVFFDNGLTLSTNDIIIFISNALSWYIIVELLHIVVDFLLILPNLIKTFFRKGGLDNE